MLLPGPRRTSSEGEARSHDDSAKLRDEIDLLKRRVERLKLYSAGLTVLMMEKLGITQAEIEGAIRLIDGADGRYDGTMQRTVFMCKKCGKAINHSADKCMYCGNEDNDVPFLERI